ncbi:SLC13 family permease [Chimaeribacter arupi]|uniref:SLC13 family permease n=1 Tax=Yersiniaceae TaxID=1903411 RepID=UPI00093245F2|nr:MULTISPECIES: SLC13 family permease [Yersiniaceae]WKZ93428.1 SLC13 family permease [Chimaeribacter arupi]
MVKTLFYRVLRGLFHDRLLQALLLVGVVLTALHPAAVRTFPAAVDWPTIMTLLGLLLLTKGVESSGFFDLLGRAMIRRLHRERPLALFLVAAAALLSTFMTNDVALFIVVPLTITLKKLSALPVTRLIIFEALAVNAGSLLTPIGNPQNILLWNRAGVSFAAFTGQMLPLMAVSMALLLALTWFSFRARPIKAVQLPEGVACRKPLLMTCAVLYGVFLVSVELGATGYGLLAVLVGLLLLARRVLVQIDWGLILVFIAMFIDIRLLVDLPPLRPLIGQIAHLPESGLYLLGIGLSQLISNVPATILLMNAVPSTALVAYAVNIGGFGLAIGSLANLIALRMAGDRRIWLRFHLYSLPFLLVSALAGWGLLALTG